MDSGRVCIDGRPTGASLPRRPAVGDVLLLELDLDQHQVSPSLPPSLPLSLSLLLPLSLSLVGDVLLVELDLDQHQVPCCVYVCVRA
jgi:hypothetical protein